MLTSGPDIAEQASTALRSRLSASQEAAILEATLKLVAEVGYDLTSIDEITRRTRTSKATIYRRWKGKIDLVFAALLQRAVTPQEVTFGASLRDDFLRGFTGFCGRAAAQRDLLLGLIPAFRSNPELTQLMHRRFLAIGEERAAEILRRAVARGEIPAVPQDLAKIVEVAEAMVYHRLLVTGASLDADFVVYVVDAILLPLLGAELAQPPKRAAVRVPDAPPSASRRAAREPPPGAKPVRRERPRG